MSIRNANKQERSKKVKKHAVDRFIGLSKSDNTNCRLKNEITERIRRTIERINTNTDGIFLKDVLTKKEMSKYGIPRNAFVLIKGGKADNVFIAPY